MLDKNFMMLILLVLLLLNIAVIKQLLPIVIVEVTGFEKLVVVTELKLII